MLCSVFLHLCLSFWKSDCKTGRHKQFHSECKNPEPSLVHSQVMALARRFLWNPHQESLDVP